MKETLDNIRFYIIVSLAHIASKVHEWWGRQ